MSDQLQAIQPELVDLMNKIAKVLDAAFAGNGFALFVFPFNTPDGRTNYISNANRQDMLKVLENFTQKHRAQPYDGVLPTIPTNEKLDG